jgi:cytochrome c-type biogenesis protein CcmH/NrfG
VRAARRVAVGLSLLLATYYAGAELCLRLAFDSHDLHAIGDAAAWLPADAVLADMRAQQTTFAVLEGSATDLEMVAAAEEATRIDPSRPLWWVRVGERRAWAHDDAGALAAYERAIELQPWHPGVWPRVLNVARHTGDSALAADALDRTVRSHRTETTALDPGLAPTLRCRP